MSGGFFDYKQHYCNDIADDIERELREAIVEHDYSPEWGEDVIEIERKGYLVDKYISDKERMKKVAGLAVKLLRLSGIVAHRLDYLLSGDDGETSFYQRLEKDLAKENLSEMWNLLLEHESGRS